ncbi:probable cytochrome P450 6a14 [Neodiprion virginianus]|uniref:probable cytochrome P450 6a14 n=1 Tax=Neodiprion virginianus TaxID=2961670 RepID=UPI001EE73050|nr:probable cytochrome P450 6a14 [Neodiprion virginianus]
MVVHSSYFLLEFAGIIIALVISVYAYLKYVSFSYWSSRNVISPKPIIPFGHIKPVTTRKRSIGELFQDIYSEYKKHPIIGVYLFTRPNLVIADLDLLRFVLTKEFPHFHDRGVYCDEKTEPLSGHLFSLPGAKWRFLRNKFSPTFTSSKIKQMFPTVKETSNRLSLIVEKKAQNSEVIEIKDLMARFSTDVIASVAFGIDCNSLENPDAEFRAMGRKFFAPRKGIAGLVFAFPILHKLFKFTAIPEDVTNFFMGAFKEAVEYRTANNVVRRDFLDLVIQLIYKGYVHNDDEKAPLPGTVDEQKITMDEGAAQAFVFWVGGFDTSSSTVTHCLYELALNQELQEKTAAEIIRVLEEYGDVTYESIRAMPHLHKVVSETLRKYPVVPILNRECTEDIDLPGTGFRATKGTKIIVPVLGIHWDPDLYPEPEKFDPERFNEENIAKRHPYAYLPFGEGPRNCIGMRFGLVQSKVGLIRMLSKFRFTPGPNLDVPLIMDKANFVQMALNGVTLRVQMR